MTVSTRIDHDGATTIVLAGVVNLHCVCDLERALESARRMTRCVAVDMSRVRLIDRPTIEYLRDLMSPPVPLIDCPAAIARWLLTGAAATQQPDGSSGCC
jgi:hypothetical protein